MKSGGLDFSAQQDTSPQYFLPDSAAARRTRLYLARHGELVTSQEWRFVGHLDVALSDDGVRQIQLLANRLVDENIYAVYSSDLQRTVHSARIIADRLGLEPVARREFREIHLGVWEGLKLAEIRESFGNEFRERLRDVGRYRISCGESFEDVRDRVIPCLDACLKKHHGQNILIMAHGGVNRVIICHALGLGLDAIVRMEQAYACLNIIDFYDGAPVVSQLNETIRA